jgi:argonaute-like protein implicated in RNA metabolism and viral defense
MGIIEHARDIAELVKKYNDQDLYERIVKLREEILALREENLQLRENVKTLTDAAAIQNEIVRHGNCYYRTDDAEHKQPYCLTCWDYERKLVGLILSPNYYDGGTLIKCGVCSARAKTT